jgi:hypothetical protein
VTAKEGDDGVLLGTMHAGLSLHSAIGEDMLFLSLSFLLFISLTLNTRFFFLIMK